MLWDRRRIAFKRECYGAGITAAAVLNSRRTESSDHFFTANDFVPRDEEEARFEEIVFILQRELAWVTPEQYPQARETWKKNLTEKGLNAEEILLEVFEE
jgi:hypothetical protein